MIESLTELIDNYSQSQIKNLEELNKKTSGLIDGINTLKENINEMNEHMGNLKNQVVNGGGLQFSNLVKGKKNNGYARQDILMNDDDNEENNDNKKIQIMSSTIERDEFINSSKYMEVKNIKIKNIGTVTLKNLVFVKDEKESSEDIIFIGNNKNIKFQKTTLDREFSPEKVTTHSFIFKIEYPKVNRTYNLIIYAGEWSKSIKSP